MHLRSLHRNVKIRLHANPGDVCEVRGMGKSRIPLVGMLIALRGNDVPGGFHGCCKDQGQGQTVLYLSHLEQNESESWPQNYPSVLAKDIELNQSTGWFKLNDGKLFPGQSPCRCFELDVKFCTRSLWALTKTWLFLFLFAWFFVSEDYFGILDLLRPNAYIWWKKKQKPGGQASGWTYRTRAQNFRVLSLKNGVDIRTFVRKSV